jgi:hypothetical protein
MRGMLAGAAFLLIASAANAADDWDGTWAGGFDTPDGAQVIVAGNEAIGLFWREDYVLGVSSSLAADGSLTLKWSSGWATLKRTGERSADGVFEENGKAAVTLHLDRE